MVAKKIMVSTLICVLTLSTIESMNQPSSPIELPSLLLEFAAICTDKQANAKQFIRLVRHIKFDSVAQASGIKSDTMSTYFNREAYTQLIDLCSKEGQNDSKAETLLNSINIEAWEKLLECRNLKKVLKPLSKLYFFEGTPDEKIELLNKLKLAVTTLKGESSETLNKYINLEKVQALIEKALVKTDVSWDDIVSTVSTDSLPASPYVHVGNGIALICQLLKQETPSLMALIGCVRWDTLFLNLPSLLNYPVAQRLTNGLFDKEKLQTQLKRFQSNLTLDPQELREMIKKEALAQLKIPFEALDDYVDFNLLAKGLSKVRNGLPAPELKEVCNLDLIEEKTGLDLSAIFSNDVPEVVRQSKIDKALKKVTSKCPEKVLTGIYYIGPMMLLWVAGNALCPSCMDLLEPRTIYLTAPLIYLILTAWLIAGKKVRNQSPVQTLSLNIGMIKTLAALSKRFTTAPTTQENIVACIPKDDPAYESIAEFVSLLTEEHLQTLPNPYCILMLFENPRRFIARQEDFIDAISRHDQVRAPQRLARIEGLLEAQAPSRELPHYQAFKDFKNLVLDPVLSKLPHKKLINIAQYRPHLLNRYPEFLAEAQEYKVDNMSIIVLFVKALTLAHNQEREDLAS